MTPIRHASSPALRAGGGTALGRRRAWPVVTALVLALAGCSTAADDTGTPGEAKSGLHTFTSGGTERAYYLDLPEGYDAEGDPLPLVVALHGTAGSHAKWLDDTYNLAAAVGEEAVMVYPEALESAAGTRQWVTDRDVPYVEELLDRLEDEVHFDPHRILITGQSSGAGMSHEIGCQLGDRVRAVAPAAGVLMSTECTGAVAVIQVQGTADPVVPFGLAQQTSEFWAAYNGLGPVAAEPGNHPSCLQYGPEEGQLDDANPYPVHLCTHNEGEGDGRRGHAWPSIAGEAIWQTFTALPRVTSTPEEPPNGGNDKVNTDADTEATFTVRFPDEMPSTPTQGAVVVYAPGEVTPTTAPLAFMSMLFAPGTVEPGEERTYTVPVSYAAFGAAGGFQMPGTYTVMVTMHTEKGGYPIPVPGMDLWAMTTHAFVDKETPVEIDEVLILEPIAADTGL